jgi:hypothetical protein
MQTRKVVQNRQSQYINIPKDIGEALNTKKGECLNVVYAPGVGMIITKLRGADEIPTTSKTTEELQKEAAFVCSEARRKLMKITDSQVQNFHSLMMKEFVNLGLFDLKSQVDRLEKRSIEVNKVKGQLVLMRQHKKKIG